MFGVFVVVLSGLLPVIKQQAMQLQSQLLLENKGADRRPRRNVGRQHPYNKHAQKEPSNRHNKAGDGKKHIQQSSIQRLNVQHPNPTGKQKHANDVHRKSDQTQEDPSGNLLRVPIG